jgi:hypothetical protein
MNEETFYPEFDDDDLDRDKNLDESLDGVADVENLKFNADTNSFEFDVKSDDPDYDHPDPYNTAAKNGADSESSYDESNPYAIDEYIPNESLETDVDNLNMHIDDGKILKVDPRDAELARTPEDFRDDLDEEGYPKNDKKNPPPKYL